MPIHDWTRVAAGTWHDFHVAWITEIRNALNGGLLPSDYYAQAEQITGPMGPDVLALQEVNYPSNGKHGTYSTTGHSGSLAVATMPPPMRLQVQGEMDEYVLKRRTVVIRHNSGDRIVALIELVSPGNKSSRSALRSFVEKAVESLFRGYHLLIVDLFPPTVRDPLTLAAYSSGRPKCAYVEPTAVGRNLIDMPLFLTPDDYINVPLEATYLAAYRGVARKWKDVLEALA